MPGLKITFGLKDLCLPCMINPYHKAWFDQNLWFKQGIVL